MTVLVDTIGTICGEDPLREKWLIAPSLSLGHQWASATAQGGQPVANLRVKTIRSLAIELAGPALVAQKLEVLPASAGPVLVDYACHAAGDDNGYLCSLPPTAALFESIYRTLTDLRLSGLAPDDLAAEHFEVPAKGKDLQVLLKNYLDQLGERKLVDYAGILEMATGAFASRSMEALVLIPLSMHDDLHLLERTLLESMPEDAVIGIEDTIPATGNPAAEQDIELLRWVENPEEAPAPPGDGSVELYRAVGEVNEVREILRRCLAENLHLDEMEVVYTDGAKYVPLVYELLLELQPEAVSPDDLPVTFAGGLPCRYTRPGRLLACWAHWVRDGYPQEILIRMLQDGLLELPEEEENPPGYARLAGLLRNLGVARGRDRYTGCIDAEMNAMELRIASLEEDEELEPEELGSRCDSLERRKRHLGVLQRLVAGLLDLLPEGSSAAPDQCKAATALLNRFARTASGQDHAAKETLLREIEEVQGMLADTPWQVDPLEWLADLSRELHFGAGGPQPGCLHCCAFPYAGHSGRRRTFVIGLDEARFPGRPAQDPLLLDEERGRLSPSLVDSKQRLERKTASFTRLLARLAGKVSISCSGRDIGDNREHFPSPVLLKIGRAVSGRSGMDYSELKQYMGSPVSFAPGDPGRAATAGEWWMSRLSEDPLPQNARDKLEARFPHLARGREAFMQRNSPDFSIYDGLIPELENADNPYHGDGPVMSPSRLELLGCCPRKYFFKYVLRIEPPEDIAPEPDQWLDALQQGSLLHGVFEEFMRPFTTQDDGPTATRDGERLSRILEEWISQYREKYPPPTRSAFESGCAVLREAARIFLKSEEDFCRDSQPLYLETNIGIKAEGAATDLAVEEPVQLELPGGKRIRLRGIIDRIDRNRTGEPEKWTIWDYKTGSSYRYRDASDPFSGGRVVQHYLYLAMVQARMKDLGRDPAALSSFGYFFPGSKGAGERIAYTPDELAAGSECLRRLSDSVAGGAFIATNDTEEDCRWCDYRGICRHLEELASQTGSKLAQDANKHLQPFKELRGLE